ncbi:hypothetical protein DRE_04242 [Drechslerella stenobrocha 248]|uniref:Uncharacterized protein n=1 Tax=Drechslerella stenobrocha 248 TaxID=1043628 RepID=W7HT66_9PEZI|nr:hypothetical protein DRE_04242 [Drechslerella stenobrocha 248]
MRYNGNMLPACVALGCLVGSTLVAGFPAPSAEGCGIERAQGLYKRDADGNELHKGGLEKRMFKTWKNIFGGLCSTDAHRQPPARDEGNQGVNQQEPILPEQPLPIDPNLLNPQLIDQNPVQNPQLVNQNLVQNTQPLDPTVQDPLLGNLEPIQRPVEQNLVENPDVNIPLFGGDDGGEFAMVEVTDPTATRVLDPLLDPMPVQQNMNEPVNPFLSNPIIPQVLPEQRPILPQVPETGGSRNNLEDPDQFRDIGYTVPQLAEKKPRRGFRQKVRDFFGSKPKPSPSAGYLGQPINVPNQRQPAPILKNVLPPGVSSVRPRPGETGGVLDNGGGVVVSTDEPYLFLQDYLTNLEQPQPHAGPGGQNLNIPPLDPTAVIADPNLIIPNPRTVIADPSALIQGPNVQTNVQVPNIVLLDPNGQPLIQDVVVEDPAALLQEPNLLLQDPAAVLGGSGTQEQGLMDVEGPAPGNLGTSVIGGGNAGTGAIGGDLGTSVIGGNPRGSELEGEPVPARLSSSQKESIYCSFEEEIEGLCDTDGTNLLPTDQIVPADLLEGGDAGDGGAGGQSFASDNRSQGVNDSREGDFLDGNELGEGTTTTTTTTTTVLQSGPVNAGQVLPNLAGADLNIPSTDLNIPSIDLNIPSTGLNVPGTGLNIPGTGSNIPASTDLNIPNLNAPVGANVNAPVGTGTNLNVPATIQNSPADLVNFSFNSGRVVGGGNGQ